MHKYVLDTSGLSNPVMDLPEHIYVSLWAKVIEAIESGVFCWNADVAEQLKSIPGNVGATLAACNGNCCLEIGQESWPWRKYLEVVEGWRVSYKQFISEYNGNRKNTIDLVDLSVVALAKTLGKPVMSMERRNPGQPSATKLRIPDLCDRENVRHLAFNDFLEVECIKI